MIIDPASIISRLYLHHRTARETLTEHSESVAAKAVNIAEKLNLSKEERVFIREAALLHDIGIFLTHAPSIGCDGTLPYICHGYLGHDLLIKEGLPVHALVCERHTGTGLTVDDIVRNELPLPRRQMIPVSLPEKIICYADKFFSKDHGQLGVEQPVEKVRKKLLRFGPEKLAVFDKWHSFFAL